MAQIPSTEVAVSTIAEKPAPVKAKRFAQTAGVLALSMGMVGVFSMPAYAVAPETEGLPDGFTGAAQTQTLHTVAFTEEALPLDAPEGEVGSEIAAQEQAEAEAKAAAEAAASAQNASDGTSAATSATKTGVDIPAGVGGSGIVNAALAQLGVFQDCTALVENSLRAIGIPAGDLGTQIGEYTGLGGTLVTGGDYAPGDILIWSGRHVAVYIGNGQAVHGGFGGNQTVVASAFLDGAPSGVVRF